MNPEQDDKPVQTFFGVNEISRPIYSMRIVEAKVTFWLAIALLITAALILLASAFGAVEFAVAKLVAGGVSGTLGGVVLKMHNNAHAKLDELRRDHDAMQVIIQITDSGARDKAIVDFTQHLQHSVPWWKRLFVR